MKRCYRDGLKLSKSNTIKLDRINDIIDEFSLQGYKMTLRQLYYQLVSRDIIPNKQNEYQKLSVLLGKGRMAGEIDWDSIEDRIGVPRLPYESSCPSEAMDDIINAYRTDRQSNQPGRIEVWTEKDAISNILYPVTSKYHLTLVVNRGYTSITAMHKAYKRFYSNLIDEEYVTIIYLGDHDPSGLDMIRDIKDRISEFITYEFGEDVVRLFKVIPVALTQQQIRKYNPPPNPAKLTDPRASWYVKEHGTSSWEVDALEPGILNDLLEHSIESLVDPDLFDEMLEIEKEDIKKLVELQSTLG